MARDEKTMWLQLSEFTNRRDEDHHRQFCAFLEADDQGKARVVMQAFFEELRDATLIRLAHYDFAITGRGDKEEIQTTLDGVSAALDKIFIKYFKKRYVPQICRLAKLREEASQ